LRPILIVYVLIFALLLTGGLARGAVIPVLRVGQALVMLGFVLFMLAKSSRQSKSRLSLIDLAFALLMLSEAVFPILALYYRGDYLDTNAENNFGQSPLQVLLGPIQFYLLYRIVVATVSSHQQIKTILSFSFIASIVVSVLGILQKLGVGPVRDFLDTYYPSPSQGYQIEDLKQRITSTLQHYSGLGAYLSFTIIIVLACYTAQKHFKFSPWLLAATVLLDSIALVLTGTIAAWIGLVVGAIIVFKLNGRLPRTAIFISVGIILAALLFQPFVAARLDEQLGAGAAQGIVPQSFAFRITLWTNIFLPAIGHHIFLERGRRLPPTMFGQSRSLNIYFCYCAADFSIFVATFC